MKRKLSITFLSISILLISMTAHAMSAMPAPEQPYCKTRYPIVLVPGVSGFDTLLGFVDYWYRIPKNLEKDGAVVMCTALSAVNSTEVRGEQLLEQVEDFLAETGADKVNLIGHSHGSTTSQYVAAVRPDLVASVTTIAGVHKGIPLVDLYYDCAEDVQSQIALFMAIFGKTLNFLGGKNLEQDGTAMFATFSSEGTALLNEKYHLAGVPESECGEGDWSEVIDGHKLRYYSWTGNIGGSTNIFDPVDVLILYCTSLYEPLGYGDRDHDGIVTVCGSHFGQVIRDDYDWNHADEVNLMFGLRKPFSSNPISVFRQHLNRLQKAGL